MDIAYELADYLADNFGYTLATDMFIGQIPASTQGILITRGGGSMNNYLPVEESVIDIYAKYTNSSTAMTRLEAIKRHIHRMHNTSNNTAYIYSMLIMGDVEEVSRDEENFKIYRITVLIKHRTTTLIS
jgi:hypothetical protein